MQHCICVFLLYDFAIYALELLKIVNKISVDVMYMHSETVPEQKVCSLTINSLPFKNNYTYLTGEKN